MASFHKTALTISFLVLLFVAAGLTLPLCLAEEVEPPVTEPPGEEVSVFEELQGQLDQYLVLMDEGKVEEALVILEGYLEDLKALSEDGTLTDQDAHIAHVLYMTSKHLAVLARVYEAHAEKGNGNGLVNALTSSTMGHGNVYRHMEKEAGEEEEIGEEDEGAKAEGVEADTGKGAGKGKSNGKGKGGKN